MLLSTATAPASPAFGLLVRTPEHAGRRSRASQLTSGGSRRSSACTAPLRSPAALPGDPSLRVVPCDGLALRDTPYSTT
jgi:hypothetical protein